MKLTSLEWDSEFWGFRIANVDPWPVDPLVHLGAADFGQFLSPAESIGRMQAATAQGYFVADVRVTLDRPTVHGMPPIDIRFYQDGDLPELVRIARESHRITRYYADPGFPNERCHDLYETWIRNSVEGWADTVLVAGTPAHGYCTVHLDGEVGSIGLIAVAEEARGQGSGRNLVHGAVRWAHAASATRMTVVTQGRNIQAQRVFQRCGFRTCDTKLWMHRWLR